MDAVPAVLDSAVILIDHEMWLSTPTIGVSVRRRVAPPFQDPLQAMPWSPNRKRTRQIPMARTISRDRWLDWSTSKTAHVVIF